jgi:hypothetical protein
MRETLAAQPVQDLGGFEIAIDSVRLRGHARKKMARAGHFHARLRLQHFLRTEPEDWRTESRKPANRAGD